MSAAKPNALHIALRYIERGWSPVPVPHKTKRCVVTGWPDLRITSETAPQYFNGAPQSIGVLTGAASRGLNDVDLDHSYARRLAPNILPPTAATFGRAGNPKSHWLYQCEGEKFESLQFADPDVEMRDGEKAMLVELRADGGQTVFPGSVHESGEPIEWVEKGEPRLVAYEQLKQWAGTLAALALIAKRWRQGVRDELNVALMGYLQRHDWPADRIKTFIGFIIEVAGDEEGGKRLSRVGKLKKVPGRKALVDVLGENVVAAFEKWMGFEAEVAGPSDDDLALGFAEKHANTLKFVATWGAWFAWNSVKWERDITLRVFDLARLFLREERDKTLSSLTPAQQKALRHRLGAAATIYNVVKLAGNDRRLAISYEQLDADQWSLNTPGGIIDLRTGAVRPHAPHELHTKITAAAPGGDGPLWEATLAKAIPDADVRGYLQRLFGYGLTGSSRDHVVPFFFGLGGNLKGTIAHAVRGAAGDYAIEIGAEVLMESHNDRHPTELAVFHGARLAIGSEVETGRRWNEARLKRLTGGDPISARFIGKDFFEFKPSHTLILLGNYKPGLRLVNASIRRRFHLIEFNTVLAREDMDTTMPEKLQAEYGAILAWALQGCLEWQRIGLKPPEAITEATDEYLEGEDHVSLWLNENAEQRPDASAPLSQLFANYRIWCQFSGALPLGRNTFADQLAAMEGITPSKRGKHAIVFCGLKIKYHPRGEVGE